MLAVDRPEADLDPVLSAEVLVAASAGSVILMSGVSDTAKVPVALQFKPQNPSSAHRTDH